MLHLSWDDIKKGAEDIAKKVGASEFKPTFLIGITVGGLVPLALVAKELELQKVATISATSYDGHEKKGLRVHALPDVDLSKEDLLLIDDISDTGDTLRELSTLLKKEYNANSVRTAAIVIRKDKNEFRPDFFAIDSDAWIVFPWEKGVEGMQKE